MLSTRLITAIIVATVPSLALVQPRQDGGFSATLASLATCESALETAYAGVPSIPADILGWVLSEATAAEALGSCALPTFPASLSSELNSWTSAVGVWWTAHSVEVSSALMLCPSGHISSQPCTAYSFASATPTGFPTTIVTATPTNGPTVTDSNAASTAAANPSSSAGGAATTSATRNASPRETGLLTGAIAAAGFIGAVAFIL